MSIIWVLLIIAVAVAPLMSALPSEAQRYEAKIRAHAMEQGITIKLGQTPEIPARFRLPADLSLVAYRRRRWSAISGSMNLGLPSNHWVTGLACPGKAD